MNIDDITRLMANQKTDSIKVNKTSAGKFSFEVKVYCNLHDKEDVRAMNERVLHIMNHLKDTYQVEVKE